MKTENLICILAADAALRRSFASRFASMLACGIAIAAIAFLSLVGFRHDLPEAAQSLRFLFKFVVMLGLAVIAIVIARRSGSPNGDMRRWTKAIAFIPMLLAGAVVLELVSLPSGEWAHRLVGHDAWRCMALIPFLSAGPLACMLVALRHGAPAQPGLAGAMAGLAASGIATTLYAMNCADDSPLFIATWFSLAILIVTTAGYLAGRRLLVW